MKLFLLILLVITLSSCASHSLNYKEPVKPATFEIQRDYQLSFASVWEKLVEGLAKKNFIIDSVNKDSGLIVASRKVEPPSSFVDCGHWDGNFKNMRVDEKYDFKGADSANYMTKNGDVFVAINRISTLNTKSNIFVKKIDAKKTTVSVSVSYVLNFAIKSSAYVYPQGQVYGSDFLKAEWNSTEQGSLGGNNKTRCYSNFQLEKDILDLVK